MQLERPREAKLISALSLGIPAALGAPYVITPQVLGASVTICVDEEGFARIEFTRS